MQEATALAEPPRTALLSVRHDHGGFVLGLGERNALLVLGDLVALNAALAFTAVAVPKPFWISFFPSPLLAPEWFVVLSGLWLVIGALTGIFDLSISGERIAGAVRVAWTSGLVLVAYYLVPVVTPPMLKSRLMWLVLCVLVVFGVEVWRLLYVTVMGHPVLTRRALIVGTGEAGQLALEAMRLHQGSGYRPVGFITTEPHEVGHAVGGLPVLATTMELPDLLTSTNARDLVVAVSPDPEGNPYRAIAAAYEAGARVHPMAQLYEQLTGQIPVPHIGDQWLTLLPHGGQAKATYALFKRALDILGAVLGLTIGAVLFAPLAALVWIDSGLPVLFSQERIGYRGHRFRIYKIRTVRPSDSGQPTQSIWDRKATRPTRIGRLLRKVRLDEFPQFWNVLRGDMSLVGPRPFVAEEVEELQRHIPFFRSRLLVRPGLTGWAQVNSGYGTTLTDELRKLQYDLYYVRHQSVTLDLTIVLKTIAVLFRMTGR
jgi:exopolysaccharide biosynthesis polyprenyl glycosylphosphotransferase